MNIQNKLKHTLIFLGKLYKDSSYTKKDFIDGLTFNPEDPGDNPENFKIIIKHSLMEWEILVFKEVISFLQENKRADFAKEIILNIFLSDDGIRVIQSPFAMRYVDITLRQDLLPKGPTLGLSEEEEKIIFSSDAPLFNLFELSTEFNRQEEYYEAVQKIYIELLSKRPPVPGLLYQCSLGLVLKEGVLTDQDFQNAFLDFINFYLRSSFFSGYSQKEIFQFKNLLMAIPNGMSWVQGLKSEKDRNILIGILGK